MGMDLTACLICGGENGTNGCHLTIFGIDVAFVHHLVATCLPPPCRSASGIGYTIKNLSSMSGNSASYPLNSWWIDKLNSYRIVANLMQSFVSLPDLQYFKII